MFCFIFLLGHNILGTNLWAGLCTYVTSQRGIRLTLSLLLHVIICTDSLFLYPFHAPFLKLSSSVIFVAVFLLVTANTAILFSYSCHLKSLLCLLPQFLSHYLYVGIHFNSAMLYAQSFVVLQHFRIQDRGTGFLLSHLMYYTK